MKNVLSFIAFAMMVVFSLSFSTCGDDDELFSEENEEILKETEKSTLTMNGKKLYKYKEKGVNTRQLISFMYFEDRTPCRALFMDGEDFEHSKYAYQLDLCFSRFTTEDVGKEIKLIPIEWSHSISGFGIWEFKNTFAYQTTAFEGYTDEFAYVSGKMTFLNYSKDKREITIKFDNVVFKCVEHFDSNMKLDKIVINGNWTYSLYIES